MVDLLKYSNSWGITENPKQSNNTNKMCQYRWFEKGTIIQTVDSTSEKLVKENVVLTPAEKKKEPPDVQQFLRELSKLSFNDNDLLCRKSNDYHHIILPCRYKEAV